MTRKTGLLFDRAMQMCNRSKRSSSKAGNAAIWELNSILGSIGSELRIESCNAKHMLQKESHGQYEEASLCHWILGKHF